jgi:WXXGXW repeat (2 copies)
MLSPPPAYVWMPGYWAPTITGHIWIGGHGRIR